MIVNLLHLSDIHFQIGKNVILNRQSKLFNAIKNQIIGSDAVIIVTSGDIANTGQIDEYKIAGKFYKQIFDEIKNYTSILPSFIFVPGNHDILIDESKEKVRKLILKDFAANGFNDISEDLITICCEPQANYFRFVNGIKVKNVGDTIFDHKLLKVMSFKFGDKIIKFNCYNSAWHSTKKEQYGQLGYPINYLEGQVPSNRSDISISIIHHPFNWQTQDSSKALREHLAKSSEVIITGHEHESDEVLFSDLSRNYTTLHVSSPALQNVDNERISCFNLIKIDTITHTLKELKYEYDFDHSSYLNRHESEWFNIEKFSKIKDREFQLKQSFLGDLENPGAQFSHSLVDEITLSDIYIPPMFNNLTISKEKKPKFINFIDSSSALNLLDNKSEDFLKVVFGPESSGKTSLLKHIYADYYKSGFYPVYLSSDVLNEINIDKIKGLIGREFKKQYDEVENSFEEMDFSTLVLLIDDFHRFRHKSSKPLFIKNLLKLCSKVIITGNELMQFESYSRSKETTDIDIFASFERYLIQEFGITQRYALINKWYRLGREYLDISERNEYYRLVDHAQDTISSIIGKNLIPVHPIYVLTILQALETEQVDSSTGVHGYYYEFLITKALKKILKDKEEIGFYFTVAKEYSFFLFQEKIRFQPVSKIDFRVFLEMLARKYNLETLNYDEVIRTLISGKILKNADEHSLNPSYKYIYYFFIAKYLSDNIEDKESREIIDKMCDRLYRDEYSNIMIFLSHLSKSKFIIEKLLEKSKNIYGDSAPTKLETDVEIINNLRTTLPEQVLQDMDVDETRMEEIQDQERYELMEKEFEENKTAFEEYDLNEDFSAIDLLAQLTKALRTINILGNITRKSWGELIGSDKLDLAEETYLLGLRTLGSSLSLFSENQDALVQQIKVIIQKKFIRQQLSKSEIENISANFLFTLCSSISFGIIKRIVNSIGSHKLSKTFDDVQKKHPFRSVKLINTGIKLDYYPAFPMNDLETLKKENEKNMLNLTILRNLVTDYLYMYDLSYDKKQKVCELLNIKISDQRYINASSPIKK